MANGEEKTLAIARNLAGRLQVLSGNIAGCVRLLPQNLRGKVEEGRELADALYNSLEEVQTIRDLPANVLVTAKQQLNMMSDISMSVADFLVSSTPLQWLVPDVDIDSIDFDNLAGSDEYDFDIRSDTSSDQ
nr:perilipin-2-like [Lytechinus pictus]